MNTLQLFENLIPVRTSNALLVYQPVWIKGCIDEAIGCATAVFKDNNLINKVFDCNFVNDIRIAGWKVEFFKCQLLWS